MAKNLTIKDMHVRHIGGRTTRLGSSDNFLGNCYTDGNGNILYCYRTYTPVSNWEYHSRDLFNVDLSAIPRNSYIQSAKLRLFITQHNNTDNVPSPIPITIYKAEAVPWSYNNATWQVYDSGQNWGAYGMEPDTDYYAVGPVADTVNFPLPSPGTINEYRYWDLTDFIQECIDRDDMAALFVMKVEESYEYTYMYGDWCSYQDGGGDIQFYAVAGSDQAQVPCLEIVYTEPMAFFASNQDGSINEAREIFLGAGQYRIGTVVKDPNETTYQETPAKLWLKNQLSTLTMKAVEVYSPPNWATYPEPDSGNTGTGTSSDVSTSPTLTIDEEWKVVFTSSTAFDVYRDSGTGADPGQSQSWTQDGSGTVGTLYSSGTRGISFTITAGGTAFVADDKFYFTSYKDYSITGAPTDSDQLLQISKDSGGSPDGNWYHARTAMTTLTSQVVSSATLPVSNATYFNPSNKVKLFKHATSEWTQEYTINSVNKETNTIVIDANISADSGDWVHAVRMSLGDIIGGASMPFWARGMSFSTTTKEEKYQYIRAEEVI